jgi:hypothetical protein
MFTRADLNRCRFDCCRSAATAAPVGSVAFRTLIGMLVHIDYRHWIKHGELMSFASLDALEAFTLVSKATVAKARRELIALGMIRRLTPPELRGQPAVYRINVIPHVPLPFPAKMRQVLGSRNRIADLKRRREEQHMTKRRQGVLDAAYNAHAVFLDEEER